MPNLSAHRRPGFLVFVLLALVLFCTATLFAADDPAPAEPAGGFRVLCAELEGAITPAAEDALRNMIGEAQSGGYSALLIRLDTPGGLVESMRSMVKGILGAPLPVIVWVGPSGAHAASAGVFLVAASHVAAMSPQSTIGAASPVAMGGKDMDQTLRAKIENDILSLLRGMTSSRGRNVDWYERSVRDAVSITADEAAMLGVVEYVADSREDLMAQVAARGIAFGGLVMSFKAEDVRFVDFDPGVRHRILSWLLHPQVAYFLLLGGMAGLFFELTTPGAIFPGVFGGLCLILGLYALSVLPTNAAGVLLILFALVLLVLEIYVTSFGMLGVAAMAALFFGSTILFDPQSGMTGLPLSIILSTLAPLGVLLGGCVFLISRAHRSRPALGNSAMLGREAVVREWNGRTGKVLVRGEFWQADGVEGLTPGDRVLITGVEGLRLAVDRLPVEAAEAGVQRP